MEQNSTLGSLSAQRDSLRLVEATFNEAPGLALNELLSGFWMDGRNWPTTPNNSPPARWWRSRLASSSTS